MPVLLPSILLRWKGNVNHGAHQPLQPRERVPAAPPTLPPPTTQHLAVSRSAAFLFAVSLINCSFSVPPEHPGLLGARVPGLTEAAGQLGHLEPCSYPHYQGGYVLFTSLTHPEREREFQQLPCHLAGFYG